MDHYEDDHDAPCPHCGNAFTRWQECTAIGCEDGWVDVYEDDPLWYDPGDTEPCSECNGYGHLAWCPECGLDLTKAFMAPAEGEDEDEYNEHEWEWYAC